MKVSDFMVKSGIPLHMKGYELLELAITEHIKNPDCTMGKIYEQVSEKTGHSKNMIDKNISRAIASGYDYMDSKLKEKLFRSVTGYPSSGMYIKSVSYAIRNNIL